MVKSLQDTVRILARVLDVRVEDCLPKEGGVDDVWKKEKTGDELWTETEGVLQARGENSALFGQVCGVYEEK